MFVNWDFKEKGTKRSQVIELCKMKFKEKGTNRSQIIEACKLKLLGEGQKGIPYNWSLKFERFWTGSKILWSAKGEGNTNFPPKSVTCFRILFSLQNSLEKRSLTLLLLDTSWISSLVRKSTESWRSGLHMVNISDWQRFFCSFEQQKRILWNLAIFRPKAAPAEIEILWRLRTDLNSNVRAHSCFSEEKTFFL